MPHASTRPAAAIAAATTWLLLGAAVISGATGCSKKDDGPRPAAIGPSGGPGAPAPAPAPAENLPAPTTPPAPSAAAPGSGSGGTIVGRITLADARRGNVAPSDAVYLVARRVPDHPGARGALVAVKRFTASSFPIDFTLSAGDMMFQNGPFEGDLTLSARVDKDGDPMTRRKGDVFGTLDRVTVGAKGVDVKIDQLQAQDESLGAPPMMGGGMPQGHP
jgi:cytochrome c-type biogenesis protein CcmH